MTYRTRVWLHGLAAAAINGFGSGVTIVIVDPKDFNLFEGGALKLLTACLVFALLGLGTYMKDHPLPMPDDADFEVAKQKAVTAINTSGTGDATQK